MEYLILTEATLPRLLWRAILKRPTTVVAVRSLFGGSAGRLRHIIEWLKSKDRVTRLVDERPDLAPYTDYGDFLRLADPFVDAEPWLEKYFGFAETERRYGRYAIAYRHAVCNTVFRRFGTAFLVNGIRAQASAPGTRIRGLDDVDQAYFRNRFGTDVPGGIGRPRLGTLINLALFIAVSAYSALWIIGRVRFARQTETVFLGSDFVGGKHDQILWDEITSEGRDVLVVNRNKAMAAEYADMLDGRRHCCVTDGWYSPRGALVTLGEMLRDGLRLFRHGRSLPSDFYRRIAGLPHWRAVYRALFNRFRFRFFWGRDDYNTEHIVRSQELRKIGGVSLGVMHGIPSICAVMHQYRHIDFDIYYMLGRDQYERVYRRTWPAHTRVRAIGSFGMSRAELERLKAPRPNNIVCFLSPSFHQDKVMVAIETVARAFPDRKVFVNIKAPKYVAGSFAEALDRLMDRAPGNLAIDDGRSYDLLFRCQYVICESSTLTAEAIQFGLHAFALDLDSRVKSHYYRRFPDICLKSGDDIVARIRDVEAGRWHYPRHRFGSLIEMSGRVPWDVIREDMGLEPRHSGPLKHLALVSAGAGEPADDAPAAKSKPIPAPGHVS